MKLEDETRKEIGTHVARAQTACRVIRSLLYTADQGAPAERLEDALNELQDAGYQARQAFGRRAG